MRKIRRARCACGGRADSAGKGGSRPGLMIIIIGSSTQEPVPTCTRLGAHMQCVKAKRKRDGKGEKACAAEQPCRTSITVGGAWVAFKLHMRDIDRASEMALCFFSQAVSCVLCLSVCVCVCLQYRSITVSRSAL